MSGILSASVTLPNCCKTCKDSIAALYLAWLSHVPLDKSNNVLRTTPVQRDASSAVTIIVEDGKRFRVPVRCLHLQMGILPNRD